MKFQNSSIHGFKVMLCIKKRDERTDGRTEGRTDGRTDGRTNNPEAICPSNFFEVGGIKRTEELLNVLGFNNTSTLLGHFVSSPREREKRDRGDSRGDEREGQGRKRNRNESEETEEIKTFPLYPYLLQG